jgi:putative ABC transport system ATP-binding protein/macrolide transport system ATP-binding/permease protein/lipoprotein-releasing system ATP-binding protein
MVMQAHCLGKIYKTLRGKILAVDGLDLEVQPGEFLAICGRSGSGKSTLLAMLGGLCRPSAGTVSIKGTDLFSLNRAALAEFRARHFGFLFQFAGLLPNLRAIDNIALPALLGGASYTQAYDRAKVLLCQVGLEERWDAYPGELSGGQQRRVALARSLSNRPAFLLADEPTNDLDEQSEGEVLALLRDLHRVHKTSLIVVTHDPRLAQQADRVIYLQNGKLASVTQPEPQAFPSLQHLIPAVPAPLLQPMLKPAEPTPLGAGMGRFLVGFTGWVLLVVSAMWGMDFVTAKSQRQAIAEKKAERKKSEELALQHLRADIEGVAYRPDGSYEIALFLQNQGEGKAVYVLGPAVRTFIQVNRTWQELPATTVGFLDNEVREIKTKAIFRLNLRADVARYDELFKGYMHIRITNVMVVSENADPTEDIYQRTDSYYIYLKPQKVTEDDVRQRNGWKGGALVPRWIGMPAH